VLGESISGHQWKSEFFRDNRLVGQIWSSREKAFVTQEKVFSELTKARFILLGEIHTNKDHHLLQAQFLAAVAGSAKKPPRLVVEMIDESFQPLLNTYRSANPTDTKGLGDILKWEKRGWGQWENYQPNFDVAYRYKLDIFSGNLDREDVRRIGRGGVKSLKDGEEQKFALDVEYTKKQSDMLNDMLFESHCKMVPRNALSPMKLVQQARDGVMAGQMLAASKGQTAVLIAGTGHTRVDWAVPRILRARAPDSKIISVAFVEVTENDNKPQDYEVPSADNRPVYNYMYFTPRSEIKDQCAELIKRFKKKKKT